MASTNTLVIVQRNTAESFVKLNPWLPIWTHLAPIMIVNMEFAFNHPDETITFANVLPDIQVIQLHQRKVPRKKLKQDRLQGPRDYFEVTGSTHN